MSRLAALSLGLMAVVTPRVAEATQRVFLDFDSGTTANERVYTTDERNQILDLVSADYARFDFEFSLSPLRAAPSRPCSSTKGPPWAWPAGSTSAT